MPQVFAPARPRALPFLAYTWGGLQREARRRPPEQQGARAEQGEKAGAGLPRGVRPATELPQGWRDSGLHATPPGFKTRGTPSRVSANWEPGGAKLLSGMRRQLLPGLKLAEGGRA